MSGIVEKMEALQTLLNGAVDRARDFEERGIKKAATDVRKSLQEIKKAIGPLRTQIQEMKNEM